MKVICVDDEKIILDSIVAKCSQIDFVDSVRGFYSSRKALEYFEDNLKIKVDAVFLDIDMPEINGMDLAKKIKELSPETEIIFLTGFSNYAVDAFKIHASGYLLKPFTQEDLENELTIIRDKKASSKTIRNDENQVYARTFGNFDLLVNGKIVDFSWKKAKETLAYLIDRNGSSVTRKELASIVFMNEEYTRSNQTYLSKILRELHSDLEKAGCAHIFIQSKDAYYVDTNAMSADCWSFFKGEKEAIKLFHGEYMIQYNWAKDRLSRFAK